MGVPVLALDQDAAKDGTTIADFQGSPGLQVVPEDGWVFEGGGVEAVKLSLTHKPTGPVSVTLRFDTTQLKAGLAPGALAAAALTLTFTPDNWDVPQIAYLAAVDDALREGMNVGLVSFDISSSKDQDAYQSQTESLAAETDPLTGKPVPRGSVFLATRSPRSRARSSRPAPRHSSTATRVSRQATAVSPGLSSASPRGSRRDSRAAS